MLDSNVKKGNWFARHKIITGILVIIVIMGVASAGGQSSTNTSSLGSNSTNNSQEQAQNTTYEPIDAKVMIDAFDKNQLAAEKQYKDKYVEFSAEIKNISEDIVGTSFLSLVPINAGEYYVGTTIKCSFKNSDELLSVSNGQEVKLKGKVKEQSLGIVSIEECQITE